MNVTTVFILGPAGSGKTTLVARFGKYLEEQGLRVCYVNLDAAVEDLPYTPDFDIRTYYTVDDIMRKEHVGPNMALIKSVEYLLNYKDNLVTFLKNIPELYDYVLVDTPGQLELSIFHDSSIEIMKLFTEIGRSCGVFLLPSDIIKTPRDLAFLKLMALAIRYRLDVPIVTAVSKVDLNPGIDKILELDLASEDALSKVVLEGVQQDLVQELWRIIKRLEKRQRIVKVSSVTGQGLEDLHSLIYEVFCTCGDLT